MWFDNWKKGIFYLILCIPCFIQPQEVWMAIISGVMMIISAIFYCIKSIKIRQDNINTIEETYDRFEELDDDIFDEQFDDNDPTGSMLPIDQDDTVAEQEEILDV
ncbi:uncharacterized protein LOC106152752 isoform X2 [Lingula anatina]|uniref:Uncharacterized protein LOC106152752 isoform X2 n=1 Tax=Lingula anatina TaxID=7574 RepID=A0A1S3H722_LINAN|nr:uncharacterized protein LOC106152752 isoform X2 [Lingula anatina]|eukprot:XP_013381920.1 uncharacterized protein LOC106152752 isoform X2 [Lingula anatina]